MGYRDNPTRLLVVQHDASYELKKFLRDWDASIPPELIRWAIVGSGYFLLTDPAELPLALVAEMINRQRRDLHTEPDFVIYYCEMGEAQAAVPPVVMKHLSMIRRGER